MPRERRARSSITSLYCLFLRTVDVLSDAHVYFPFPFFFLKWENILENIFERVYVRSHRRESSTENHRQVSPVSRNSHNQSDVNSCKLKILAVLKKRKKNSICYWICYHGFGEFQIFSFYDCNLLPTATDDQQTSRIIQDMGNFNKERSLFRLQNQLSSLKLLVILIS